MSATAALGWALLQFLWQGALLGLLAKLLLVMLPRRAAELRYTVLVGALAVMPASVVFTAWSGAVATPPSRSAPAMAQPANEAPSPAPPATTVPLAVPHSPSVVAHASNVAVPSLRQHSDAASAWIVGTWAVGAMALALRLLASWFATRRLVRADGRVPEAVPAMLARLATRLGVRRAVRVCTSGLTRAPAVAGWLRPVVLLPASVVTGLPSSQLEAILAHELAHIRRHDYLVNLLQSLIETLLFYHPAVWWLGARIREEREHCCDDLAVAACGDAPRYAEALLSLEQLRGAPELALTATRGSLLARVERLLGPRPRNEAFPRWMAGLSAVAIVLLFVATSDFAQAAPARGDLADGDALAGSEVILRHPDASQALAQRSAWAHSEASARGDGDYWVGHSLAANPALGEGLLLARFDRPGVIVEDSRGNPLGLTGRVTAAGTLRQLHLPGEPLAPRVGADPGDTCVMFLCSTRSSPLAVQRVHVATAGLPMDLQGLPLLWLGRAGDRESVDDVLARLDNAPTSTIRQDLIGVLGAPGASSLVVPELARILASMSLDDELRAEAARVLGLHPVPDALQALDATARADRSLRVRCEAAEAIGTQRFAPAFDALLALAHGLDDRTVRLQAVEAIGDRTEPAAADALLAIARGDPDPLIQREAAETLGDLPDGAGREALGALARSHPSAGVRKEAAESRADSR